MREAEQEMKGWMGVKQEKAVVAKARGIAEEVFRIKLMSQTLGTLATQWRARTEAEGTKCRVCGDAEETNMHVLWKCARNVKIAAARQEMEKEVAAAFREAGMSEEMLVQAGMLWRLHGDGAARVGADITEAKLVKWGLEPEVAGKTVQAVQEVGGSGLRYARAGLLGQGVLEIWRLCGLREDELPVLAESVMAKLWQGTAKVWKAFADLVGEAGEGHGKAMQTRLGAVIRDALHKADGEGVIALQDKLQRMKMKKRRKWLQEYEVKRGAGATSEEARGDADAKVGGEDEEKRHKENAQLKASMNWWLTRTTREQKRAKEGPVDTVEAERVLGTLSDSEEEDEGEREVRLGRRRQREKDHAVRGAAEMRQGRRARDRGEKEEEREKEGLSHHCDSPGGSFGKRKEKCKSNRSSKVGNLMSKRAKICTKASARSRARRARTLRVVER